VWRQCLVGQVGQIVSIDDSYGPVLRKGGNILNQLECERPSRQV